MLFSVAILVTPMNRCEGTKITNRMSLVAWWLWKHRSTCVFEETAPSVPRIIQDIKEYARLWCMASAKGLRVE
jgi:hypothetical protein